MTLAVKAKEQYLVGLYSTSLDTFREVQRQISSHISALEHELEHGDPLADPAGTSRKAVEDAYEEWSKCLGMLQEEFQIVQQLQETGQAFKIAPGAHAGEKASGAFAVPGLTDAQLQAQHLAKQAATDIRDPDVWPPPTTEAPVRPTKARQASAGFVPSQWAAAAPAPQPASAARSAMANARTPMKGPVPAASDDDAAQPSNRLPAWAANPAPAPAAASRAAAPVARPRFVRKPSEPPAGAVAPSAAAAPAAAAPKPKAAVPARKPAVPTGGRKSVAPSKHKKDDSSSAAAPSSAAPAEDGGRVKYEAATKEEQEMAEMIEREILDKRPNVKMDDIAGLAGAKQLLQEAVVLPRLIPGYFTGKRKPWRGVLMFGPPVSGSDRGERRGQSALCALSY